MTTTVAAASWVIDRVEVLGIHRLSPSFVRLELGGPCLAEVGTDGPTYDQRIKLVLPPPGGRVPPVPASAEWYAAWRALPRGQRGHLRTYTIRDLRGVGEQARLVVDVVVHGAGHSAGHGTGHGPGCAWAAGARVGDQVVLVGPRRGHPSGGIEFAPGTATRVLLAGDETAVPAVAAILEQLPASMTGAAFLEVPDPADVQTVRHPAGVDVTWLPRGSTAHGALLHVAVLGHLGVRPGGAAGGSGSADDVDPDLWETPTYSSSGEDLDVPAPLGADHADLYAWIAGESGVVTGLRRVLVRQLGMDRRRVAFMGYWRRGVAMPS